MPADAPYIDKAEVARRFNRSALTYDDHSRIQRRLAARVMAELGRRPDPARILELGCGTGQLTALLAHRYPQAEIRALDLAGRMVEVARSRVGAGVEFAVADAEQEEAASGCYDLIVSSATIQWFADPVGALARLGRALAEGGRMVHATFGPATFRELRSATGAVAGGPAGLPLRSADEWMAVLDGAGLVPAPSASRIEVDYHPSARAFLAALGATGATWRPGALPGQPGPRRLSGILDRYEARFAGPRGVPATYELVLLAASRQPEPAAVRGHV